MFNVSVKAQDNGGNANNGVDTSSSQTFIITVTAVNHPPVFENPSGSQSSYDINEGASLAIPITLSDYDGTIPVLSLISPPAWASISGSGLTWTLSITPPYTVASNAFTPVSISILARAIDQVDAAIYASHTFIAQVTNVNRAPVFADPKPQNANVQVGRIYEVDVTVTDPDSDALTYTFPQGPAGITYDATIKKLRWNADRLLYSIADGTLQITMRASDGKTAVEHSWQITLVPHQWEYMGIYKDSANTSFYLSARDSLKLYKLSQKNSGGVLVKVIPSNDGGKSWNDNMSLYLQLSWIGYTQATSTKLITLKNNFAGAADMGGEIDDISGNQVTFEKTFTAKNSVNGNDRFYDYCYDINPLGKILIAAHSAFFLEARKVYIYDMDDSQDSLIDLGLELSLRAIQSARNSKTAFLFTDSLLFRRHSTAIPPQWQNVGPSLVNVDTVQAVDVCSANGDTIYLVNRYFQLFKCFNGNSNMPSFENHTTIQLPKYLKMINSRAGWIVNNSDGTLYYTNNGLSQFTKEVTKDSTNVDVAIEKIIRAADGKTFFAIGDGKLFRY